MAQLCLKGMGNRVLHLLTDTAPEQLGFPTNSTQIEIDTVIKYCIASQFGAAIKMPHYTNIYIYM